MAKATFHRVDHSDPGTGVFQIKGRVGYRENEALQKLVDECRKRDFKRVVFDLTELESLGGRGARILREFAMEWESTHSPLFFVIDSPHVKKFLQAGKAEPVGEFVSSIEEALGGPAGSAPGEGSRPSVAKVASQPEASADLLEQVEALIENEESETPAPAADPVGRSTAGKASRQGTGEEAPPATDPSLEATVIRTPKRGKAGTARGNASKAGDSPPGGGQVPRSDDDADEIFGDRRDTARPTIVPEGVGIEQEPEQVLDDLFVEYKQAPPQASDPEARVDMSTQSGLESEELKRQVLALKSLLSISSDFNSIRDKGRLLDLFLLSSISQGGVQCAAFFRLDGTDFWASASKGCDLDEIRRIPLRDQYKAVSEAAPTLRVVDLSELGLSEELVHALTNAGFRFGTPFRVKGHLMGLVFFGDLISESMNKELRFDLISILSNQAAIAYENAFLFEEQHDRTLGVVKALVTMIEKNTLTAGTAELVSRYAGMLAREVNYPDDYFRDLIYGTVLRDIGMVGVSDLIIRSPRELTEEEWEVIKQHPGTGADMLRRMKFSEHTCEIVLCHHERFNGEGYPSQLRGRAIPLGARIVSAVESFIAMLHDRPSRPALSPAEAIDSIAENWGNRYDPQVLDPFVAMIKEELRKKVDILAEAPEGEPVA